MCDEGCVYVYVCVRLDEAAVSDGPGQEEGRRQRPEERLQGRNQLGDAVDGAP